MSSILKEFMKDEIEEERRKAVLDAKKSMAVNLSAQGVDIDCIARAAKVEMDTVREWVKEGIRASWPQGFDRDVVKLKSFRTPVDIEHTVVWKYDNFSVLTY